MAFCTPQKKVSNEGNDGSGSGPGKDTGKDGNVTYKPLTIEWFKENAVIIALAVSFIALISRGK